MTALWADHACGWRPDGILLAGFTDELCEFDAAGIERATLDPPYDHAFTAIATTASWLAAMDRSGRVWIAPYARVYRRPARVDTRT